MDKKENNLYYVYDNYTIRVLLDITAQTYNGEVQIKLRTSANLFLPFANGQRMLNFSNKTRKFEIYMCEEYNKSGYIGNFSFENFDQKSLVTAVETSPDEMFVFAAIGCEEPVSKLLKISIFRVKIDGKNFDFWTEFSPFQNNFDSIFDLRCDFEEEMCPILVFSERFSKRICSFILKEKQLLQFGTLETAITTHELVWIAKNEAGYTIADSVFNLWNFAFFEDLGHIGKVKKKGKCCSLI